MELAPDVIDITLVTGIKTLTWATGTKLVAGLSSSYVMVDVENKQITDIVGPGSIGGAPGQDGGRFGGLESQVWDTWVLVAQCQSRLPQGWEETSCCWQRYQYIVH
jgi:hypothetical protein